MLWAIWNVRNDHVFNKPKQTFFFAGYPIGYPLDPYVVLSPTSGASQCHGFWVQHFGDGSQGFIQPVRLAAA